MRSKKTRGTIKVPGIVDTGDTTVGDDAVLKHIRGFMLDMDGTLYLSDRVLPGAVEFVSACKESGRKVLFLTNNSSKTKNQYVEKLNRLGISADIGEILTSGEATVTYMKNAGIGPNVYILGTKPLIEEFESGGFVVDEINPDAVVLGFDMDLTYERLMKACLHIRNGVTYIATHPDINCPTERGPIPDCGSMIAAIEASTGRRPKIIGKPNPEMVSGALEKIGLTRDEVAMVGDRLYTDIAMGVRSKIASVLVLSGESKLDDLAESEFEPDLVVDGIEDLLDSLR